jgi:hypothetical protein
MLCEIIEHAIASETDMAIVEGAAVEADDLGSYSRANRIDVIIFPAGSGYLTDARVGELLYTNPRLGLLSMDTAGDRAELHHLVPAHDDFGRLSQTSLTKAIRAGASLRRR